MKYIVGLILIGYLTFCFNTTVADKETYLNQDVLVNNSPWSFESYELLKIINKQDADVNEALIKFWVYDNSQTIESTFYNNGTGKFIDTAKNQIVSFKWTLKNNEMEIILDLNNSPRVVYENMELSESQFKFEKEDIGFDKKDIPERFYGTYFYH